MRVVAWDTWAFVETALGYRRKGEVQRLWRETEIVVTARDIVGETFSFITGRTRDNGAARRWLDTAMESGVRIVDPSLHELVDFLDEHPGATAGSWADAALAFVADQAGAHQVASEDAGFGQFGLEPVFARDGG